MSQSYSVKLANELLYIDHDTVYQSHRLGRHGGTITRQDREHHGPTIDRSRVLMMTPYPTNMAICGRSVLPNARTDGIHDLRGTDSIWARAIISDHQQDKRFLYQGVLSQ
jgi:hypothetical protein